MFRMKTFLMSGTAGSYGSPAFRNNLVHFHRYLDSEIQNKLTTELTFRFIESKSHKLCVSYITDPFEKGSPVYFTLNDKTTGRSARAEIGRANHFQLPFWLQTISLTRNKIKIKSSQSVAACVFLKDKPQIMEFDIEDFISLHAQGMGRV